MFVSHVCGLVRSTHFRHCIAVAGIARRQFSKIKSKGDQAKNAFRQMSAVDIHGTITELCNYHRTDGIKQSMSLIKKMGKKRPDVSLVSYLSVIDICLDRDLMVDALDAYKQIRKLGFVLETPMAEKLINLAVLKHHFPAIQKLMNDQPLTTHMMLETVVPLVMNGMTKYYGEYLKRYFDTKGLLAKEAITVYDCYRRTENRRKATKKLSKSEKEAAKRVDAILLNYYVAIFPNAPDFWECHKLMRESEFYEDDEDKSNNNNNKKVENQPKPPSHNRASDYSVRVGITDWNAANVNIQVSYDIYSRRFQFLRHPHVQTVSNKLLLKANSQQLDPLYNHNYFEEQETQILEDSQSSSSPQGEDPFMLPAGVPMMMLPHTMEQPPGFVTVMHVSIMENGDVIFTKPGDRRVDAQNDKDEAVTADKEEEWDEDEEDDDDDHDDDENE